MIATSIYTANKRFSVFLQLAGGKFSKFELKLFWEQEGTEHLFPLLCSGWFLLCSEQQSYKERSNFHILYQQKYILSCFMGAGTRQQFSLTSILGAIDENVKNYRLSKRRQNNCVFTPAQRAERRFRCLCSCLFCCCSLGCFMCSPALDPPQGDKHGNKNTLLYFFSLMFGGSFLWETKGAPHNNAATHSRGDVPLMARKHLLSTTGVLMNF